MRLKTASVRRYLVTNGNKMVDQQQFCLRWNNHGSTLVAVFDNLLANESLVDVTLFAEGHLLKAHKVVLSACSPYFQTLFAQTTDKHPIVILKDVKYIELKALLEYMYRGEVNVSQDQLGPLIKTAESLKIKGLADGAKTDREIRDGRDHSREGREIRDQRDRDVRDLRDSRDSRDGRDLRLERDSREGRDSHPIHSTVSQNVSKLENPHLDPKFSRPGLDAFPIPPQ
ncbi:hypothetical protein SK128_018631, partial [Halocaridina rubra]